MSTVVEVTLKEIVELAHWGGWTERDTREGKRMVRCCIIDERIRPFFWPSWHREKAMWYAEGYSVQKFGQTWQLVQYLDVNGQVTERAKSYAAAAKEEERLNLLAADWIPDDVTLESPQSALLLNYQRPAALRLKRALLGMATPAGFHSFGTPNGNALDASDTGTGKTFIALVICAELGLKPCVVAPLAVLPSWQRAAKYLGVSLGWLINYDKLRNGRSGIGKWRDLAQVTGDPNKKGERFVYDYLPGDKPIVIFDEVQKCKAQDTKQGKILRDTARQGHKILCLSATAAKDPTEMRNLGAAIGLHDGSMKSFDEFCRANGCFSTSYGLAFQGNQGKRHLEKLHRQIFPLRGQRIRIADVPTFPETVIQADALDTGNTETIKAVYDALEHKLDEIAASNSRNKAAEGLAAMMAARIAAEKGKLDLFVQLAEEALEEEKSVVLFVNFRAHVEELAERLKTTCIVYGGQKPDVRQQNIDDFNSDKSRVIIVSLQAGGAGLSLHDLNGNFPRVAIISPSYSAIDLKQALGRVHRAGGKTKSFQRIIFAAGTIEEEICTSMREKLANIETINDGDLEPGGVAERLKKCRLSGESKDLL